MTTAKDSKDAKADPRARDARDAKSDKDDKANAPSGDATEIGPHNTEGHFGKYNVVIANDTDGIQRFAYHCANGQELEMTSEDAGQTWSNDEVGTLGVSGVGDLLEHLDGMDPGDKDAVGKAAAQANEPAKSSTWSTK
jgi:hypothetical protein